MLVNKRKRERQLSGGIREAQSGADGEGVTVLASLQRRNGRCEKRLVVVVVLRRSAQLLIEMKSAGSELFSLWPFFFLPATPSPFSAA